METLNTSSSFSISIFLFQRYIHKKYKKGLKNIKTGFVTCLKAHTHTKFLAAYLIVCCVVQQPAVGAGYICILGAHRWPLGLYTTPTILGMGHQLPMAQTGRLLQAIYTTMAGSSAACWRTRLTGSWQHHKCYSSSGRSCFNNSIQLLNFDFCGSEKKVLSTYWKKKCLYYLVLIVCLISKSATLRLQIDIIEK